jgi:hypothetical protein
VKTNVLKDGHVFTIHVLDPKVPGDVEDEEGEKKDEVEKGEMETQEKDGTAFFASDLFLNGVEHCRVRSIISYVCETLFLLENKEEKGEAEEEPQETKEEPKKPEKPCVGRFGSFCAQFDDGLSLSLSTYGSSGLPVNGIY